MAELPETRKVEYTIMIREKVRKSNSCQALRTIHSLQITGQTGYGMGQMICGMLIKMMEQLE